MIFNLSFGGQNKNSIRNGTNASDGSQTLFAIESTSVENLDKLVPVNL
jgi:hypothetical protein